MRYLSSMGCMRCAFMCNGWSLLEEQDSEGGRVGVRRRGRRTTRPSWTSSCSSAP